MEWPRGGIPNMKSGRLVQMAHEVSLLFCESRVFFKAWETCHERHSDTNGGRIAEQIGSGVPPYLLDKLYGMGVNKQCP